LQDQIRYGERVNFVIGARRDRARSKVDAGEAQIDYATTFRAGLIVNAGRGFSPYVSYSESFLPTVGLDFYGRAFTPQLGEQYEAGVKWQPFRGALITLNGFRITEKNRQTNDPDNVLNTIQTGEVQARGAELEAAFELADDFMLTAALSYVDAEVTRSTFVPEVGVQLSDVPKEQGSVWAVKTLDVSDELSLRFGGGVRYVGPTLSTSASGSIATPSYTLADALLALDASNWTLSASAANLFDKSYYAPCRAFGDCFTGNRRSIIGTLTYRF
jgi:iron complex outermembrane receptor protein